MEEKLVKTSNKNVSSNLLDFIIENKILLIVILLFAGMSVATDSFLTMANITNVTRQITVSSLLALGFTVVVASGNMDLSVGTMLGLVGLITAKAMNAGVPVALCIALALILGAVLGYLNGLFITVFKLNGFVFTLATQMVFQGAGYIISNNASIGNIPETIKFLGQGFVFGFIPTSLLILVIVTLLLVLIIRRTKFGRYVLALGGNPKASLASGINNEKITRFVYMTSGICAGIAAIVMTGRVGSAQASAGQGMEMDAIAAVVMGGTSITGGKARIVGTVVGCLTVGVIINGLNLAHVNPNWQIVAKGLLIISAIMLDSQSSKILFKFMTKSK
jgi:ribose transport system permease protein